MTCSIIKHSQMETNTPTPTHMHTHTYLPRKKDGANKARLRIDSLRDPVLYLGPKRGNQYNPYPYPYP